LRSLRFPLDASAGLKTFVMLLHAVATAAVWLSALPPGLATAATALIALNQIRESRRPAAAGGSLCYGDGLGWSLERNGSEPASVEILGSTVVTPWVIWVHARSADADHAWTFSTGDGDADTFRRLRVCLRVAGLKHSAVSGRSRPGTAQDGYS
jgi:hypothetical protein